MHAISLSVDEIRYIEALLEETKPLFKSSEDAAFLKHATTIAHRLPRRVREFLNDFRLLEPSGVCTILGYPVDDGLVGATPCHWDCRNPASSVQKMELLFILLSSLLGEAIGWATQQGGYIVHDVLPIKGNEQQQIGTGSEQPIWWHNEDAFHPLRGDYVGLMCLRNPDKTPTTFASIDAVNLSPGHLKTLFEPRFYIRPDESHLETNGGESAADTAYAGIKLMHSKPEKVPILFGDPNSPYIRIDPYFMDPVEDDEAAAALNALIGQVDSKISEVALSPGDFLFVDNYRAVHGRRPFKARYDGTDRWLKRINITRDLRKSRASRSSCWSRIIA